MSRVTSRLWVRSLGRLILVSFLVGNAVAQRHWDGKKEILMPQVGEETIQIDGDLSEWQHLPYSYIDVFWDVTESDNPSPERDRARFYLCHDTSALYFAIRVVDESVQPSTEQALHRGNCVQLFVDVRPIEAPEGTPRLGQRAYSPGCYQLTFVPQRSPTDELLWGHNWNGGPKPQQLQVISKRLVDGYLFEIRIPFTDLNRISFERLRSSIGFDLGVNDRDAGGHKRDYVWGGKSRNWYFADQFQRAIPVTGETESHSLIRLNTTFSNHSRTFIAGVVLPMDGHVEDSALKLSYDFRGTIADRPSREADWEVAGNDANPSPIATESVEQWTDPVLGLRIIERTLQFTQLVGGRYTFTTHFDGLGEAVRQTTRAYYTESLTKPSMDLLEKSTAPTALTNAIRHSIRLETPLYHVFDVPHTAITIDFRQSPEVRWGLSEGLQQGKTDYLLRLEVTSFSAQAERGEIPKSKVAYSIDVPLHLHELKALIPTGDLAAGVYLVRPRLIAPDSSVHEVWNSDADVTAAIFLGVHHRPVPVMETKLLDKVPQFTQATFLGSPNLKRYPEDTPLHTYARSVWDLQTYNGRIYIGCGDMASNQGPIDIWSFASVADTIESVTFTKEYTVDEESVDTMRVYDEMLMIPGVDTNESIELGNLYFKAEGKWRKMRTVPNGRHVLDIARHKDKLYVTASTSNGAALFESSDEGQTWVRHTLEGLDGFRDWFYWEMAILDDTVVVMANEGADRLYQFKAGKFERLIVPVFPGVVTTDLPPLRGYRLMPFAGGVVYTVRRFYRRFHHPNPLFFLKEAAHGAAIIEQFKNEAVQDILAQENLCYVLTSRPKDEHYANAIYSSVDLLQWAKIADFTTPACAHSFEEMNGVFYVGLASVSNRIDVASGGIYRLDR